MMPTITVSALLALAVLVCLGCVSGTNHCGLDPTLYVSAARNLNIAVFLDIHQAAPDGCGAINPLAVQELEAVSFVFDSLNDIDYVPGVTLGYVAYDTCSSPHLAAESLRHLTSRVDNRYVTSACSNTSELILGIAGPSTSPEALAMSRILMAERPHDRLVQISHSATASVVTSGGDFGNAYSVIPPDNLQAQVIVDLLKQLGWNYVALMHTDDVYGTNGAEEILRLANSSRICVAFVEKLSSISNGNEVTQSLNRIVRYGGNTRQPSSGVVFFGSVEVADEVAKQAATYPQKLQFIFSDSVQFISDFLPEHWRTVSGAVFVEPTFRKISSLENHLKNLYGNRNALLQKSSSNPWLEEVYRNKANCPSGTPLASCPDLQDMANLTTTSVFSYYMLQLAFLYAKLMKAVYQGRCTGWPCQGLETVSRETVRAKLAAMTVSFAEFGSAAPAEIESGSIVFHINGTRVPSQYSSGVYEVQNLHVNNCPGNDNYCLKKVGSFNGKTLNFNVTDVKSYNSDNVEIPRVLAQCPVGVVCEACLARDSARHWVYLPGDLIIVAVAPIHNPGRDPYTCADIRTDKGFQLAEAILFAVRKVNEKQGIFGGLFQGKTIGVLLMNSCYSATVSQKSTLSVFFGDDPYLSSLVTEIASRIIGFVGGVRSDVSEAVAHILTETKMVQIAYGSTSVTLSNHVEYPYFLRTCASDRRQGEIMISLLMDLNWMYVSVVYVDDSYGKNGLDVIQELSRQNGICIAQAVKVGQNPQYYTVLETLRKTPSAKVVVLFVRSSSAQQFLEALSTKEDYQTGEFIFILTESVGNRASVIANSPAAVGSFSLLQEVPENQEFNQFMSGLKVSRDSPEQVWLDEYWEAFLGCYRPNSYNKSSHQACSPDASLTDGGYFQDPWTPFAINAVYSLVLGADSAARRLCGASGVLCPEYRTQPMSVRADILKTRLDLFGTGAQISAFDEWGDGTVGFSVFKIQNIGGVPSYVKAGYWSEEQGLELDMGVIGTRFPDSMCPNQRDCQACVNRQTANVSCTSMSQDLQQSSLPIVAGILGGAVLILAIILIYVCYKFRTVSRSKPAELTRENGGWLNGGAPDTEVDYLHATEIYATVRESYGLQPQTPPPDVQDPRADVQGPRAYVQGPRAYVQGPRADVQGPRADVQGPRADVQGPRVYVAETDPHYRDNTPTYLEGPPTFCNPTPASSGVSTS